MTKFQALKKFPALKKFQALQSSLPGRELPQERGQTGLPEGWSVCRSHRRKFTWDTSGSSWWGWFFFFGGFGFFWTPLNSNSLDHRSRPETGAEHSVNGGKAELFPFILILSKFVFQMIKQSEEFQHPQSLWLKCTFPKSSLMQDPAAAGPSSQTIPFPLIQVGSASGPTSTL